MNRPGWKIQDDLADTGLSRQRKYQIRKMRQGQCIICGKPAYRSTQFCISHGKRRGIRNIGKNGPRPRKWVDWVPEEVGKD